MDTIQTDSEREVEQRAQFLSRKYDLKKSAATALAWNERGYSVGGIASAMELTEGTVKSYLAMIQDTLGNAPLEESPPVPDTDEPLGLATRSDEGEEQ